MTMQERQPGYAPQLTPIDYSTKFGEFIGIGPNGNLFVDGDDPGDGFGRNVRHRKILYW